MSASSNMNVSDISFCRMGYESATAQGLSALPHLAAFIGVWVFSNLSDRSNTRSLFIIPIALLSMMGYILLALAPKLGLPAVLKYLCLFPITVGFFTAVTLTIVWTLDNQVSSSSKGAGVVLLNIFGQMAPLVGTGLYPARDKPNYVPGHAICAAFMGMVAVLAASLRLFLARKNGAQVDQDYEMVGVNGDQGAGLDDEDQTGLAFGKPKARFEYML